LATVRTSDVVVARLEEQVRELRAALEDAAEGICRVDLDGRVLSVNRAFTRLMGASAEASIGANWETFVAAEHRAALREDLRAEADKVEREVLGVRADGATFEMQLAIVPVVDAARPAPAKGHYFFIRDLSERKRMENQLIFAGRMAAVGTLAAGVAHEINNPLAYIVANIDFARHQLTTVASRLSRSAAGGGPAHVLDETGEALTEARQGAERVRNIVRDLRIFARGDEDQSGPVAIRRVLDSSINIAWNEIRHRARLVKDYGDTPMVEGNESRLGQVFLNLLLNAAHAIPEGETERNEIRVSTRTDGQGRAIVEVRDTGMGIPPEIRERIFDPFFTTKPVGEGTGLGLWICSGILNALGGEVRVDSEIGRGSTFRVTLPAAVMDSPGELVSPPAPEAAQGGKLLVIDDEPMILGALRRALSAEYNVTCVGDGRKALERLRGGERYELILCDLMMPEMTGMDLFAELQKVAPEQAARMVFVSGGAFTPRAREFLERIPNARVEKPIDLQNLRLLLRTLSR
jgi:PAS domain S-box-containing protein